jgi:ribosomal protein S18 acetylase RimI-like enzyme
MESPVFRIATTADTDLMAELAGNTFRQAYHQVWESSGLEDYISRSFTPEQLGAELRDPDCTFILMYHYQAVAGYAKLRRGHNPPDLQENRAVQIQRFYLRDEYYGKGLGDRLMEFCLQTVRKDGYTTAWLAVWPENTRAVRFYQRRGFEVTGSYPFYHGEAVAQDWLMQKELEQAKDPKPGKGRPEEETSPAF